MKFLLTGHSEFALGIQSALKMIVGELEDVTVIPFFGDKGLEEYRKKIEVEIQTEKQVVCFTDLLGGTPFKTCVEFSVTKDQIFVISGTNLGMVLEGLMLRNVITEPFELAKAVVQSGRDNIVLFEKDNEEDELPEEGI